MKQRWAMFAMGAWLCGTLITSVVATENFYTVDRLLTQSTNPTFSSQVDRLGHPQARELLRYLSSELNRLYFQLWNATQLALGVVALWLIGRNPAAAKARLGVMGMLGVVVLMILWLTPEITSLGRGLDFVPRDPRPPALSRFWILHAAYTFLSVCNLVAGVIVTGWIQRSSRTRKRKPPSIRQAGCGWKNKVGHRATRKGYPAGNPLGNFGTGGTDARRFLQTALSHPIRTHH